MKLFWININNYHGFTQYMHDEFLNNGHESILMGNSISLIGEYCIKSGRGTVSYYSNKGNPFSLKAFMGFYGQCVNKTDSCDCTTCIDCELFELDFDIVFVEQAKFYYDNDIEVPVCFYHRDLWSEAFMKNPDLLLYRFKNHLDTLGYNSRQTLKMTRWRKQFHNAVKPEVFNKGLEKRFEGLNFIGTRTPFEKYNEIDLVQRDYYQHAYKVQEYLRETGIARIHDYETMDFPVYKKVLEQCAAVITVPGNNAYVSRRIYEAAVCGALNLIYVQNDEAQEIYTEWGLVHGFNCLFFRHPEQIEDIYTLADNKEEIAEEGCQWVLNRHTYEIRAKELEKVLEDFLKQYHETHLCPNCGEELYWDLGMYALCCGKNKMELAAMDKALMSEEEKKIIAEQIIINELQKIKEEQE